MTELHFKRLNHDNWQQSDSTLSIFSRLSLQDGSIQTLSGDDWAKEILAVELSERVPLEVRRLFAVAQGALVYGYFFYPLYTLGAEQLFRVAESAVGRKCRELGLSKAKLSKLNFQGQLAYLVEEEVIHSSAQLRWDTLRRLRNLTSHPDDQMILSPSDAIVELRRIVDDINGLFRE